MEYYYFLNCLNEEKRAKLYNAIFEERSLEESEQKSILEDVKKFFEKQNTEEIIKLLMKYCGEEEKEKIKKLAVDKKVYDKYFGDVVFSFEEIGDMLPERIVSVMSTLSEEEISKALVGTSPDNREKIIDVLKKNGRDINMVFVGNIPISAISDAQNKIVENANRL